MRGLPSKRRIVWRQSFDSVLHKFFCTHCGFQISGAYERIVLSIDDEKRNTFEIWRHCDDCW